MRCNYTVITGRQAVKLCEIDLVCLKVLSIKILVLLPSVIALHQIAYGLVLIGGFSLGLASLLTSLGLAAVYGQQWLEKSPFGAGVMQRLSVVSALATVCITVGVQQAC